MNNLLSAWRGKQKKGNPRFGLPFLAVNSRPGPTICIRPGTVFGRNTLLTEQLTAV